MPTNSGRLIVSSIACAFVMQSCAALNPRIVSMPCDEKFEALFPMGREERGLEITGKVRLELPRYRIRGLCRILYSPEGKIRMDFRHSSLFGAVREDVTILAGDSVAIYDHENGRFFGNDSSLAFLQKVLGCDARPDDILHALLLASPKCADLQSAALEESGERWKLKALWRDRRIEMSGEKGIGPRMLRQCFSNESRCIIIDYDRYASVSDFLYPRRLRLSRNGGKERITLELTDIKTVTPSDSIFDFEWLEAH